MHSICPLYTVNKSSLLTHVTPQYTWFITITLLLPTCWKRKGETWSNCESYLSTTQRPILSTCTVYTKIAQASGKLGSKKRNWICKLSAVKPKRRLINGYMGLEPDNDILCHSNKTHYVALKSENICVISFKQIHNRASVMCQSITEITVCLSHFNGFNRPHRLFGQLPIAPVWWFMQLWGLCIELDMFHTTLSSWEAAQNAAQSKCYHLVLLWNRVKFLWLHSVY